MREALSGPHPSCRTDVSVMAGCSSGKPGEPGCVWWWGVEGEVVGWGNREEGEGRHEEGETGW